jgi:hypothetical protein
MYLQAQIASRGIYEDNTTHTAQISVEIIDAGDRTKNWEKQFDTTEIVPVEKADNQYNSLIYAKKIVTESGI